MRLSKGAPWPTLPAVSYSLHLDQRLCVSNMDMGVPHWCDALPGGPSLRAKLKQYNHLVLSILASAAHTQPRGKERVGKQRVKKVGVGGEGELLPLEPG